MVPNNTSGSDLNARITMQIYRIISAALLLLLLLIQSSYAAESKETKAVLVLYSEDKAHPAHELTDKGIREAFRSNKLFHAQLYTEYLDLSRFSGPAHERALADYLHRKYSNSKIDAIIAVYPATIELLLGEARAAFPGVPIVACEVSRSYAESLNSSPSRSFVTGVVMGGNMAGMLEAALRMRPDTRRVALIAGTEPNDRYSEQVFRNGLKPYAGKLELIDLTKLPMEDILTRVRSLPPDTIVLYSGILRDGKGTNFVPREALSMVSQASNTPVFSLYDTFLGYGIVGGRLVSFEQQGKEAAALALRILGGESPASIPFTGDQAYVNLYDWRELRRWNLPESAVASGSEIRYRQPSLWEEHTREITGVVVLIMLETGLIFALVTNLRRRRKAERSLMESEERVRLAVSSAGAGLWSLDTGTGRIWGTDKTRELLGIGLDEELNFGKFLALVHPEDREGVGRAMQQTLQPEQETSIEYRIGRPDGNVRWISSRGRLQQLPAGESIRLMGVFIDITQRKQAALEAQKHREDLARVSRLASLGELSAALAHQISQPLTAILTNAQAAARYLSKKQPNLDEVRETVADIIQDDKRASEIIRRLRALFGTGKVELISVDLNEVVREAAGFARDSERLNSVSLVLSLQEGLPPVDVDVLHLEQVILNLVFNGIEAMEGLRSEHREIRISTERCDGDGVRVSVQDRGPGINETTKDQMFQAFQTTKPEGMGMGLSLCRSIIEAHGGRLWAENCPDGSGATFSFTVPTQRGTKR
jgi:PAS domain S-box-containing protein